MSFFLPRRRFFVTFGIRPPGLPNRNDIFRSVTTNKASLPKRRDTRQATFNLPNLPFCNERVLAAKLHVPEIETASIGCNTAGFNCFNANSGLPESCKAGSLAVLTSEYQGLFLSFFLSVLARRIFFSAWLAASRFCWSERSYGFSLIALVKLTAAPAYSLLRYWISPSSA
jgi:hypothetical protein